MDAEVLTPHRPTLASWGARTRRKPSCCGRFYSVKPTACSTCTRPSAAASVRWRRACGRRSRASAHGSSRSHVELMLHQGSGELHTVTGVSLVDAHRPAREDSYRLSVGLVGAEAMLRLFVEEERNERAFEALTRFLSAVDAMPAGSRGRAALDPVALAFQLKLLWLSGYVPHLESCVECGGERTGSSATSPEPGGAVCSPCAPDETVFLSPDGFREGSRSSGESALRRARPGALASARCATRFRWSSPLRVPRRLPPAHAGRMKRDLGDGYELDDDPGGSTARRCTGT